MTIYAQDIYLNNQHDLQHNFYPNTLEHRRYIIQTIPDYSCLTCYPILENIPDRFLSFWDWFTLEFPATCFTYNSIVVFRRIIQRLVVSEDYLEALTITFRYSSEVNFYTLITRIRQALILTDRFTLDPLTTLYYHSETTSLHSNSSEESLSDFDYNLDLLFQTPPPSPKLNMATIQNVYDYLINNDKGPTLLQIAPFYGNGTQDPLTWMANFEKAAVANKWNSRKKRDVLPAFLRDNADEWQQTFYPANAATNNADNDWTTVKNGFTTQFCNQRWHNKWIKELEELKQMPDESIDTYYSRYRRIIQRVETSTNLTNDQKLYHFNKGLSPETLPIILLHAPNNVAAALDRARTFEQGKDFTSKAEPATPSNIRNLEKDIETLTKQMQQMTLNYATIATALTPRENSSRNNQNFRTQPRPKSSVICYKCGKAGHIARNCLAKRNTTTAQYKQLTRDMKQ